MFAHPVVGPGKATVWYTVANHGGTPQGSVEHSSTPWGTPPTNRDPVITAAAPPGHPSLLSEVRHAAQPRSTRGRFTTAPHERRGRAATPTKSERVANGRLSGDIAPDCPHGLVGVMQEAPEAGPRCSPGWRACASGGHRTQGSTPNSAPRSRTLWGHPVLPAVYSHHCRGNNSPHDRQETQ